jgi:choline kinase
MKLKDFAIIKTSFSDADFWLVRRGSIDMVGKPVKNYDPEYIGVKVTSDKILPNFLFYWFMNFHNTGYWKTVATGATNLVNIKTEDVKNIPVG